MYTKGEWGVGASSGSGDHNLIRSFYFSLALTVLTAPVSLACLVLGVLALFKMPLATLVIVFFGTLFGFACLHCWFNVKEEWRGRKARKLKGLPKPWWVAADDQAYEWFLTHPDPRIQMTLDYFPYSVKLRKQEAAWSFGRKTGTRNRGLLLHDLVVLPLGQAPGEMAAGTRSQADSGRTRSGHIRYRPGWLACGVRRCGRAKEARRGWIRRSRWSRL